MNIFKTLFASLYVAIPLMGIYAILIAVATFIENDYGSNAARALIYNTWFFNFLHIWLLVVLIGVMFRYKLLQNKKYASFVLHLSFVVIIIGAGVTRFFGVEGTMHIREGEEVSSFTSMENYLNIMVSDNGAKYIIHIPTNISYATNRMLSEKVAFGDNSFKIKSNSISKMNNDKADSTSIINGFIEYSGKEIPFELIGGSGIGEDKIISIDDNVDIIMNWGAREIMLDFSIKLDDFILERYPGSMAPSSYESKITLFDKAKDLTMPYEIYMNHTLDYKGYRFFQSSYDADEGGTILSVNNDPGKIPTYLGYILLVIGSVWILFASNSRFKKLSKFLQSQNIYSLIFIALFIGFNSPLNAQEKAESNITKIESKKIESSIESKPSEMESKSNLSTSNNINSIESSVVNHLDLLKNNSKEHAKLFGELQIQDFGGRVKPLDTLASDFVHKITKKNNFLGFSNTQIILGMIVYPNEWKYVKMIKVSTPQLKEILGVDENSSHVSFMDLLEDSGAYKLINYAEEANRKKPQERSKFDNDVLDVDERINLAYGIYTAMFLKMLPVPRSGEMWLSPMDMLDFSGEELRAKIENLLQNYFSGVDEGVLNNNWAKANDALKAIKTYQKENSTEALYLNESKLNAEIFLNNTNIFKQLILPYLALGLLSFILVFVYIFRPKPSIKKALKLLYYLSAFVVVLHLLALLLRWYVSNHAPWSNAYESMLYIAFTAGVAGVIFFRKSYLAISTSVFLAGISLFVANLGFMDPQIGNLVPVLKSYWLNIHVSVITASYGFLGLCFLLGIITLLLFLIRKPNLSKVDSIINSITAINEMSMILGLVLLCVGNFLGAVWANESWGRYWGWDPKETWALASIGIYAIILHLRFIFRKNLQYIFAASSVVGFFSILMTYFGVNYYLSGLHSYAGGDPLPIPIFLYFMVGIVIALIVFAFFKKNMESMKV